jgi:polyribonucleotide 5'-hydroxyl-kinase
MCACFCVCLWLIPTHHNPTQQYFYGVSNEFQPHSQTIKFSDIRVYRAVIQRASAVNTLPIGQKSLMEVMSVNLTDSKEFHLKERKALEKQLVAVSFAKKPEDLLKENVAGFLWIERIDEQKQTMTVLSPSPGPLPGHLLLVGSLAWVDTGR